MRRALLIGAVVLAGCARKPPEREAEPPPGIPTDNHTAPAIAAPPAKAPDDDEAGQPSRTPDEDKELNALIDVYSGGFCLGGNLAHARQPAAFEMRYGPMLTAPAAPTPLGVGDLRLWGAPNIMERILFGIDQELVNMILASPFWGGTPADLLGLVQSRSLGTRTLLPLRDAIDRVYASIYTTIKAMKFSELPLTCGGPVEVATITADRHFRWVRHKPLDAAIEYRGLTND